MTGQRQTGVAQGMIGDVLAGGEGMLSAMEPLFQRNLEQTLRMNREFGGPSRFNTAVGDKGVELSQRALQDYNLFQQQALEQARNRQLQAVLGIGGLTGQATGQQQAVMQQLLGAGLTGGGAFSAPVITQSPGLFQNIMQGAGTLGGLGVGLFGGGAG
jgi:hypothetical protein